MFLLPRQVKCPRRVLMTSHLIVPLAAVAVHDYLLCFPMEMQSIWFCSPKRLSLSNALYVFCRLIVFMGCIMVWLPQAVDSVSALQRVRPST